MANVILDVSGEKEVVMTNAYFGRKPVPVIFSSWTTLRVALFYKVNDSGANITGTPRFGFGLCSGTTNILGDATTTHFVGAITNAATWTRATGPIRYVDGSAWVPSKKVGSTLTTGTTFGTAFHHTTVLQTAFVDITKGSPNYSLRVFVPSSNTAPVQTLTDFNTQSVLASPAFTSCNYLAAQTVAVDEATDGTLDAACVWWNQTVPTIQIAAWRVFKIA